LRLLAPGGSDVVSQLIGVNVLVTGYIANGKISLAIELIRSAYRNPTL
jgi:hypothetical protein